jgi:hypothetical protein
MPLALVLFSGLGVLALTLRQKGIAKSSCRRAVWLAQVDLGQTLQELLRLNPEARTLLRQREVTLKELKLATALGQWPLVASLKIELARITLHQVQLRARQQRLQLQARLRRQQTQSDFLKRSNEVQLHHVAIENRVADLAVFARPPQAIAPEWELMPEFHGRQQMTIRWQARLMNEVPQGLTKALNLPALQLNGQCAASLKQEKKIWIPYLVAVKF